MHPLESPEYNFVNEELLKFCFEKQDPIKPVRQIIANRIHNDQENKNDYKTCCTPKMYPYF